MFSVDRLKKSWRKIVIAAVGFPVIAVGVALLVLPGPGLLVIVAGVAILALEFEWARKHHLRLRRELKKTVKKLSR